MKGKLLFVAGLATGYVVGSRAGRSAYTDLVQKLRAARGSDAVQSVIGKVKGAAEERVPKLTATVSSVADTTSSVAQAAASATDSSGGSQPEQSGQEQSVQEEPTPQSSSKSPSSSRGRSRTGASGSSGETAEEAAKVFEEQLPESGDAVDGSASSLPADASGGADESQTPTATS